MDELAYRRNNQNWRMTVTHFIDSDYRVEVDPADSTQRFTYKQYQRTNDADIQYKGPGGYLNKGRVVASFFIGAEVVVIEEPSFVVPTSPWNFASSEQMENWDVVLCVDGSKFYAHKQTLSLMSTTFRSMFEGDFREKDQQEVPVNVEGTNADHFEAFLQCLYPYGREPKSEFLVPLATIADYFNVKPVLERCVDMLARLPNVSKLDKLRVAIKAHSAALEDEVISTLSKEDIRELLASDIKDHLNEARWEKLTARLLSF